jgi:N-acetylmuramoyl-L-alanine amidase
LGGYRQVVNGRGGTKECQTTGTTTDAGYLEHSFNWDVVLRIREELTQLGVRTAMSRGDDNALGPAVRLAQVMASQLAASGLTPSTYRGADGLYGRADLAGLNLAQYPAILIELGNMKNQQEAAAMVTAEGRAKYAAAVVQGITAYLAQRGS